MMNYYDLVLAIIPICLCGLTIGLSAAGIPQAVSLFVGAGVAAGVMGHAMFVNAPVPTEPPSEFSMDSGGDDLGMA